MAWPLLLFALVACEPSSVLSSTPPEPGPAPAAASGEGAARVPAPPPEPEPDIVLVDLESATVDSLVDRFGPEPTEQRSHWAVSDGQIHRSWALQFEHSEDRKVAEAEAAAIRAWAETMGFERPPGASTDGQLVRDNGRGGKESIAIDVWREADPTVRRPPRYLPRVEVVEEWAELELTRLPALVQRYPELGRHVPTFIVDHPGTIPVAGLSESRERYDHFWTVRYERSPEIGALYRSLAEAGVAAGWEIDPAADPGSGYPRGEHRCRGTRLTFHLFGWHGDPGGQGLIIDIRAPSSRFVRAADCPIVDRSPG